MRASLEEKARSHDRIIASAARLFRRDGTQAASVGDVMNDAGLTHGGFYKHFNSKDALLAAALDRAFDEIFAMVEQGSAEQGPATAARFRAFYLSDGHVAAPSIGCPIAALGNDVARGSDLLKTRFGAGVRRVIDMLAQGIRGPRHTRQAQATRQLAMMAGAIMIARASDPETARAVLAACRDRSAQS